jgi:hypothetical protein
MNLVEYLLSMGEAFIFYEYIKNNLNKYNSNISN